MRIEKYGIVLQRLEENDLEHLRRQRNAAHIQRYMEFREHITPEQQRAWFHSINNNQNLYFTLWYEGRSIGLINSKNIQWEPLESDAGLFIWEEQLWNTQIPAFSTLILLEVSFLSLTAEKSRCQVLRDNPRAQNFNQQLGYTLMSGQREVYNQQYELTREYFFRKTIKIIRAAETITTPDKSILTVTFYPEDVASGLTEHIFPLIDKARVIESITHEDATIYRFYPVKEK
ncbi:MAG: GNAT family N-acetyltransferase [Victivallales bacterium]